MTDLRIVHNIDKEEWARDLEVGQIFLCEEERVGIILELEVLAISPRGYLKLIDKIDNSIVWHKPSWLSAQKKLLDIIE